jgi:putative nucleotidyltransferase with HDIG domain
MQKVGPSVKRDERFSIRETLKNYIYIRWMAIALSVPVLFITAKFSPKSVLLFPLISLILICGLCNMAYYFLVKLDRTDLKKLSVFSGCCDILLITFAIVFTGGMDSPLFVFYLTILTASAFIFVQDNLSMYFTAAILFSYFGVFIYYTRGMLMSPMLDDFLIREVFFLVTAVFVHNISKEMKVQDILVLKNSEEKEKFLEEIRLMNLVLEEKVTNATDKLEKTNMLLVKKNISLLAAHEIYRTANDARTRGELLNMILGIVVPLMKSTGGAVISFTDNKSRAVIECSRRMASDCGTVSENEMLIEKESVVYRMLIDKKSRLFDNFDVPESPDAVLKEAGASGSCIVVPLLSGNQIEGIMAVYNSTPGVYSKPDMELAELLGEQVGTLLQNRALYDEMSVKAEGLEKLMKVTAVVSSSLEVEEVLSVALTEGIKKLFIGSSGCIIIPDENRNLSIKAQYGFKDTALLNMQIPKESIAGFVFNNDRNLIIKNPERLNFYNPAVDASYIKKACILVPFYSKSRIAGIISLTKPKGSYSREDLYFLTILAGSTGRDVEIAKLYGDMKRDYINSIYALAAAVDAKDHYTHGHSTTVMRYSTKIAEKMGLPADEIETIQYAGLLHDIGKIGISENIINKPSRLTKEEYAIIKMHPQLGANIISRIDSLKKLVPMVLAHHEWYNGTGYPLGLRGEEIPLGGRIISVADAYSTITSKRPYRDARTVMDGITELRKCSGTQFDKDIVEFFVLVLEQELKDEQEASAAQEKAALEAAAPSAEDPKDKKERKRIRVKLDDGDNSTDEEFYS